LRRYLKSSIKGELGLENRGDEFGKKIIEVMKGMNKTGAKEACFVCPKCNGKAWVKFYKHYGPVFEKRVSRGILAYCENGCFRAMS